MTKTVAASEVAAGMQVVADDGYRLLVKSVALRGGNITLTFEKDERSSGEIDPQTVQASARVKVVVACEYCRDGQVFRVDQNCPKCGTVGTKPAKFDAERKAARS